MDCSAEEQMVRMKLEPLNQISHLEFDLAKRTLSVYHTSKVDEISIALAELNLSDDFKGTIEAEPPNSKAEKSQRKTLIIVLLINAFLFVAEMTTGIIAHSMGLIADSLDMFADAIVYGLSLYAVGKAISKKKQIASISGYFQISLAIIGFSEILRRFVGFGETPNFNLMIIVSIIALLGNSLCLWLMNREKSDEAHMKASWIFTTNDIIVNLGVITAGILVWQFNSRIPDLIIGLIVFVVVVRGALRILKLGK